MAYTDLTIGNITIPNTNGTLTLTTGTGTIGLSDDAANTTVNLATGGAIKTTILGSVNSTSATTVQSGSGALNVTATGGALTINSGVGALGISTDASATTISIGTGGAVKGLTLGSVSSTSGTTLQSGTTGIGITATNGPITINAGTGTIGIATDGTTETINIGTGGGIKTTTIGSTNSSSQTIIQCGNSILTIHSGTGSINLSTSALAIQINQAGATIQYPAQPCFSAYASTQSNVTGDGTTYQIIFANADVNIGTMLNTGTGTVTIPATGRYQFNINITVSGLTVAMTNSNLIINQAGSQTRTYTIYTGNIQASSSIGFFSVSGSVIINCTANDTIKITLLILNGTKAAAVSGGGAGNSSFSGWLLG